MFIDLLHISISFIEIYSVSDKMLIKRFKKLREMTAYIIDYRFKIYNI